ncbi:MAG: hypothetical protein ACI8QZ_003486 [Chlamydiales bacterium]|jgi:hypothetical protein
MVYAHLNSTMGLDIPALRILRETIRIYQDCQTYSDQGQATVFSSEPGQRGRRELRFATAFRRPSRLRFDVRPAPLIESADGEPPLYSPPSESGASREDAVVCWDGEAVETWMADEPVPVESLTIESILAEVSDLPTAAAGYVAHLLLCKPEDLAQERRARYHGTRSIEEGECHKLTIPAAAGRTALTLWLDVESHLIRRLLEVHRPVAAHSGARPVQTILRFQPQLDGGVRDELFDYQPPSRPD